MATRTITIEMSEAMYNTLQATAEKFSFDEFRALFEIETNADVDAIMETMKNYTDVQLWIVVGRRMATAKSQRMWELIAENKARKLAPAEDAELDVFLEEVDRDMLLRSEALLQLHKRGYDVSRFFNAVDDGD
jgi:hypothetical protein